MLECEPRLAQNGCYSFSWSADCGKKTFFASYSSTTTKHCTAVLLMIGRARLTTDTSLRNTNVDPSIKVVEHNLGAHVRVYMRMHIHIYICTDTKQATEP